MIWKSWLMSSAHPSNKCATGCRRFNDPARKASLFSLYESIKLAQSRNVTPRHVCNLRDMAEPVRYGTYTRHLKHPASFVGSLLKLRTVFATFVLQETSRTVEALGGRLFNGMQSDWAAKSATLPISCTPMASIRPTLRLSKRSEFPAAFVHEQIATNAHFHRWNGPCGSTTIAGRHCRTRSKTKLLNLGGHVVDGVHNHCKTFWRREAVIRTFHNGQAHVLTFGMFQQPIRNRDIHIRIGGSL